MRVSQFHENQSERSAIEPMMKMTQHQTIRPF
jgi:hypothetical protein